MGSRSVDRRTVLALGAALVGTAIVPATAFATTPSQALADVDRFRRAMLPLAGNAVLRIEPAMSAVRFERTLDGITLVEPAAATWTAATPTEAWVPRLLAAFLAAGPLATSMDALGYPLGDTELGWAPNPGADGDPLVRRIGGPLASIAFEPGIARPRHLEVGRDETRWSVTALTYSAAAQGWFPERLDVRDANGVVASFAVLDAAPYRQDLAPLAAVAAPSRAPVGRQPPRLPL